MGATLADGGVNPLTGQRVIDSATCHYTLAAMSTAGLYETSADWLYEIGLPGKSARSFSIGFPLCHGFHDRSIQSNDNELVGFRLPGHAVRAGQPIGIG